jgi:hypothetical protein
MLIPHAPFKGQQLSFCVPSYILLSLLMHMLLISFTSPYEFHFMFYSAYSCFCSFCLTHFILSVNLFTIVSWHHCHFWIPSPFQSWFSFPLSEPLLSKLYLCTWSWRKRVVSKHWYLSTKLHEISVQKAVIGRLVQFVLLFFCFINNPINRSFHSCDGPFYVKVYVISSQGRHDTIPHILLNNLWNE